MSLALDLTLGVKFLIKPVIPIKDKASSGFKVSGTDLLVVCSILVFLLYRKEAAPSGTGDT